MVNDAVSNPERSLALSYAPAAARAGMAALLALDDVLAGVVRTTRDPLVGQMRLTWWREALEGLDRGPPPSHPVLEALAGSVLSAGVTGAALGQIVDGWEALLDREPLTPERIEDHARGRGAGLFGVAGRVLGAAPADPLDAAGRGWALADLSGHLSDERERSAARGQALAFLARAAEHRWSKAGRALGALAMSARLDLAGRHAPGAPRRVARLAWHRISGR